MATRARARVLLLNSGSDPITDNAMIDFLTTDDPNPTPAGVFGMSNTSAGKMLYEQSWNFNDQPTTPMQFSVNKGENLNLDCKYQNTTSQTVAYGESTEQEMCAFVLYYTPYPSLDGCMN